MNDFKFSYTEKISSFKKTFYEKLSIFRAIILSIIDR